MKWILQRFVELKTVVQVGLVAGAVAVLLSAILLLAKSAATRLTIAGGILVVLAVLGLYALVIAWLERRRGLPFEEEVRAASAAAPRGLSPADLARLDDLRKKFEEGIDIFRERGKRLYSLPWYVIIGEPAAGKSKAIEHSGIGFPPGLQDERQGTGGTINMDWWFANDAVILDTAGRLVFATAESSSSREWLEFLRLLRQCRPRCPINGLILAIPADALIADDAEKAREKAGKLARQLNLIQRALGVRFPVYLVITKADLMTGFRQFFSGITHPELQVQIFGWSNGAPLDAPFGSSSIMLLLNHMKQCLQRRRTALLQSLASPDPGSPGNRPAASRAVQVEELYAFPHAFESIVPALKQYVELIFDAGEWSYKPLFVRGVYLTSSMQEGGELDLEVARLRNVPVRSLKGSGWQEKRSFFLRDLFKKKMFPEKGLVTRSASAAGYWRRQMAVMYGGVLALLLVVGGLAGMATLGYHADLRPSLLDWQTVDDLADRKIWDNGNFDKELPDLLRVIQDSAALEINVPVSFRLMLRLRDSPPSAKERKKALGELFRRTVVEPIARACQARVDQAPQAQDADSVREQLRLIRNGPCAPLSADDLNRPVFDIDLLLGFVAPVGQYNDEMSDGAEMLQQVWQWLYDGEGGGQCWPPEEVSTALAAPSGDAVKSTR